ncbi:hypothetical protein [Pseudomonas luteola]|nr:hypothetical protein [Pseudomonas luteola]
MKTFIRPVTIACDDDYYQFIGSGTAFICQYRGKVFVVCARHTWEKMGITIENFRIFIPGYDWALPFDYEAVFGPEERSDLKVLRIDSQIMASNPPALMRAFDLNSFIVPPEDFDAVITMRTDFSHVDDIDGLSGSPVFLSGAPHLFAGVVIRAGQDAGLIHFIHGACLIHAMDALVELPPRLMMN